jgi:hypothetical protein
MNCLVYAYRKSLKIRERSRPGKMNPEPKNTTASSQPLQNRKRGWWSRFLERLAKANAESPAVVCRH